VAFALCGIPHDKPIRALRDSALGWKAVIRSSRLNADSAPPDPAHRAAS
jgi:hypothetical protein